MASFFPDANTVVSGLLFNGPEAELLRQGALGLAALSIDEYVFREVRRALTKPAFGLDPPAQNRLMALVASWVTMLPAAPEQLVSENLARLRDKKDVPVLVAFEVSGCDHLVTGDSELLRATARGRRTRQAIRMVKQSLRSSFAESSDDD